MSKTEIYRHKLSGLKNWIPYLRKNSGLPGPRGNLELAHAVALEANRSQIEECVSTPFETARENTPGVFVLFCGLLGLGILASQGDFEQLTRLRRFASDPRWRVREGVATALQLVGDQNMVLLIKQMRVWSQGNWYEKRAAAAALAEPRLLNNSRQAIQVMVILDSITKAIASAGSPTDDSFRTCRQAMGYCWSVAVAAFPTGGKPLMEKWSRVQNSDVRWIMKQNLQKNRLIKMDSVWVEANITLLQLTKA
jgi:hypothetical protein